MSAINDGGAAFPGEKVRMSAGYPTAERDPVPGMTLRDYFATHSTQPGMIEICKVAGIGYDKSHRVYPKEASAGVHFDDWWQTLTLERQCDICAQVRYAQADAMLRARRQA